MKHFLMLGFFLLLASPVLAEDDCPSASVDDSIINPPAQNQGWLGSCGAYTMAQMADAWRASQDLGNRTNYASNPTSGLLTTILTFNHGNSVGSQYQDINGPSIPQVFDAIQSSGRDFSCSPERTDELILQYARSKGVQINSADRLTLFFSQANKYYRELYSRYAGKLQHSQMLSSYQEASGRAFSDPDAKDFLETFGRMEQALCQNLTGLPIAQTNISSFDFIRELFFLDGQQDLLRYISQNCGERKRSILGTRRPRLNRFDYASGRNSREDHINAFNTAFTQNPIQPVAVGYCHSILTSRRTFRMDFRSGNGSDPDTLVQNPLTGSCAPHWGVVSAQFKSATGTCMVRVRSTHGRSCAKYAPHLGCENGHVWIPRDTLLDNMDEAYYFSR